MFDKAFVLEYFKNEKERISREIIYERELKPEIIKNKVTVIAGPRRAGKTYLLYFLARKTGGIYLNLEHSAFREVTHKDIFEIISLYREYFGKSGNILLLDEVQRIGEWERLVRSLLDSGYKVIISGSSSKLLPREIATQLRGRSLTYILLPLSFREYLRFKNISVEKLISISEKVKILKQLEEFLEWGAYPEIVIEWDKKEKILKEYFETIMEKDFIERFEIVNTFIAKTIFEFVFQNFSKEISTNKIANFVSTKLGRNVKNIVYDYVEKLPETLAVYFLRKFTKSVYERSGIKKVYVSDTGLSNALLFDKNYGKRMENAVFLELLRKTNENPLLEIYYWKDYQQREVDFVIKEGIKVKQLIQVTYASAVDEIEKRELKSLIKASDLLKCKNLLCITWDYEGEEEFKGRNIRFVPLWKWLLKM